MLEKPKKALFPISIDNPGFSSKLMLSALAALDSVYDEIVFFVADELQIYNKVSEVESGAELGDALALFAEKNVYFDERKRWFEKIRRQAKPEIQNAKWTYVNISSFTDQKFYQILRNIFLAFHTISDFRRDVNETAQKFCLKTKGRAEDVDVRLSELYILEEIALNLRIRVCENIYSEFYAFKYPKPMIAIYSGEYGISVSALTGVEDNGAEFEFYEFTGGIEPSWEKICNVALK